jgi:cellulose biosynthesis protein BcsQ
MNHEEIIDCPKSGGDLCYKIQVTPDINNFMSLSCGFYSNSLMKEGEEFYEQTIESLPELHKDLAWKDPKTDLIWLPNVINEQSKGMIFANGTSIRDWHWAAVKAIELTEEEQKNTQYLVKKVNI